MTKSTDFTDTLKEQPFVTHLLELRDRVMRAFIGVLVIFVCLFPWANELYQMVSKPLLEVLPEGQNMIATGVISPFLAPFKLTLVAAIFLAMPLILYQMWAFIAPGLYKREKRILMPMVGSSALLFYLGAFFAYAVVFPLIFDFMKMTTPEGVDMIPDITQYLELVLTLFFAFGIAFEVPIATIIVVWMGMTTPDKLIQKRPYVIVGAFCLGMFLTPPDVISQTLLALPMWILFEFGVIASRFIRKKEDDEEEGADPDGDPEPDPDKPAGKTSEANVVAATATAGETIQSPEGEPSVESQLSDFDAERYQHLSEEELDKELDLIEAEEASEETSAEITEADEEDDDDDDLGESDDDGEYEEVINEKFKLVQQLRDEENEISARGVLYEIIGEGNEDQANTARNIMAQLDED